MEKENQLKRMSLTKTEQCFAQLLVGVMKIDESKVYMLYVIVCVASLAFQLLIFCSSFIIVPLFHSHSVRSNDSFHIQSSMFIYKLNSILIFAHNIM